LPALKWHYVDDDHVVDDDDVGLKYCRLGLSSCGGIYNFFHVFRHVLLDLA